MNIVNRAAIVVRSKTPYLEWASRLDKGDAVTVKPQLAVYLVPMGEDELPERVLRRNFAQIFAEELEAWHLNASEWPQRRTFEVFQQWFEAEVVDLVQDLGERPLGWEA